MKFVTGAAIAFTLVVAAVVGGVVWQQTRASAAPPDPAEVRITPATINIPEGATDTVELGVFGLDVDQNLEAFGVFVSYDPAIVDATGCTFEIKPGSCNPTFENNNLDPDEVVSSGCCGPFGTGDLTLAGFEFQALVGQAGNCTPLTVSVNTLFTSTPENDMVPIPHNTVNGEICVTAGPAPSPTLTGERGTAVLTNLFRTDGGGGSKARSGVVTFANPQPDTDYTVTFVGTDVLCGGQMVTEKTITGFRAVCGGNFPRATIDWAVIR